MRPSPDCVPCLLKRVLFQARLLDNGTEAQAMEAALKAYSDNISSADNSARLATLVHRAAYDAMGVDDPYRELKALSDGAAMKYMPFMERFVRESDNSFRAAVLAAVIGNVMDFGSGIAIDHPDEFDGQFRGILDQGVDEGAANRLQAAVMAADSIVYIFDNCGEAQFDKLLIRELRGMGKRVVGVVRGAPILNDVTMEDAVRIGLDAEVDRMLTTNAFAIGIDLDLIGDDLREELDVAGLVIAKGMANYESLSDEDPGVPVVYLMRAKCIPVSDALGARVGENIVHFQD